MLRFLDRFLNCTVLGAGIAVASASATHAQVSVLSNTVEEHVGTRGESYSGRITISNPGGKPETIRLYQTDYSFTADGVSHFEAPGEMPRSNASWISLQSSQVVVPAGATISVPYSVAIPNVDSLRGTYWSTVMVEGAAKPPEVDTANTTQVGIGTIIRYAVQVATHIGASGTRAVKFAGTRGARTDEGASVVELDVLDAGERGYRPALWIEVYDAEGTLRAKAKQARGLLYPGTSLRQRFDLGKLPAGTYKAMIFADTGEDSVYAAQYTIVF
jgi:hypothetical protein